MGFKSVMRKIFRSEFDPPDILSKKKTYVGSKTNNSRSRLKRRHIDKRDARNHGPQAFPRRAAASVPNDLATGVGLVLANQIDALRSFGLLCSASSRNHHFRLCLSLSFTGLRAMKRIFATLIQFASAMDNDEDKH